MPRPVVYEGPARFGRPVEGNAYADAAATAYMGASEIEDATAVIREAVRTRPCLYTDRRRTADREWGREVLDRRTYYATRGHTNE